MIIFMLTTFHRNHQIHWEINKFFKTPILFDVPAVFQADAVTLLGSRDPVQA